MCNYPKNETRLTHAIEQKRKEFKEMEGEYDVGMSLNSIETLENIAMATICGSNARRSDETEYVRLAIEDLRMLTFWFNDEEYFEAEENENGEEFEEVQVAREA